VPEAVCHLEGTVSGSAYHAENSVVVDQSGGISATTLDLDASSATAASGSAVTTYTLGDLGCVWSYDFAVTYAPEPGGAGLAALLALGALRAGSPSARAARRLPRSPLHPPLEH
jgi:hypothetical protein